MDALRGGLIAAPILALLVALGGGGLAHAAQAAVAPDQAARDRAAEAQAAPDQDVGRLGDLHDLSGHYDARMPLPNSEEAVRGLIPQIIQGPSSRARLVTLPTSEGEPRSAVVTAVEPVAGTDSSIRAGGSSMPPRLPPPLLDAGTAAERGVEQVTATIGAPTSMAPIQLAVDGLFEAGSVSLSDAGRAELRALLPALRQLSALSDLQLTGYADGRGDAHANLAWSLRQARTLADYLVAQGLPKAALHPRALLPNESSGACPAPCGSARRLDITPQARVAAH